LSDRDDTELFSTSFLNQATGDADFHAHHRLSLLQRLFASSLEGTSETRVCEKLGAVIASIVGRSFQFYNAFWSAVGPLATSIDPVPRLEKGRPSI
jgi:hypothetical protein